MTRQKIAAALRAAGFQSKSYDSGFALTPCTTGSCIEYTWVNGQQVAQPKGEHRHRVKVRQTENRRGFELYANADGSFTVMWVDPLEVSRRLSSAGFDVVLKEKYGWQAYSDKVQYSPAVVVGIKVAGGPR
jgi:hypothetical protein